MTTASRSQSCFLPLKWQYIVLFNWFLFLSLPCLALTRSKKIIFSRWAKAVTVRDVAAFRIFSHAHSYHFRPLPNIWKRPSSKHQNSKESQSIYLQRIPVRRNKQPNEAFTPNACFGIHPEPGKQATGKPQKRYKNRFSTWKPRMGHSARKHTTRLLNRTNEVRSAWTAHKIR